MLGRVLGGVALCSLSLCGCASTTGVADSATSTNLEFERSQNEALLLNVARASLRRPPAYLALQSVNASVRPSGEVSFSIPFGPGAGPNNFGLSAKANDGPTLVSAPLDTQEFYQGIMTPIKPAIIDFYVQQGYPKELLFNLFFGRIEIRRGDDTLVIRNYPGSNDDLDAFQTLVNLLVNAGLTTERVGDGASAYGPLRTADEVRGLVDVSRAATAGLTVTAVGHCGITEGDMKLLAEGGSSRSKWRTLVLKYKDIKSACDGAAGGAEPQEVRKMFADLPSTLYRVEKPSSDVTVQFCFDPLTADDSRPRTCSRNTEQHAKLSLKFDRIRVALAAHAAFADRIKHFCEEIERNTAQSPKTKTKCDDEKVGISFVVRSTDGVVYYLGELARRRLYPDVLDPSKPAAGRTIGYRKDPKPGSPAGSKSPCTLKSEAQDDAADWDDSDCTAIFWVSQRASSEDVVNVLYDGATFAVRGAQPMHGGSDRVHPGGRSSQVLGIVNQLIALNKSAKDSPSTKILNVVNP